MMTFDDSATAVRLASALGWQTPDSAAPPYSIGILSGEGIGPEVIRASLAVLEAIESATSHRFALRYGGPIGLEAQRQTGQVLTEEVDRFCREIFAEGGAVFCGPGGGRFVYELRERFDLFCKLVPLKPLPALRDIGPLRPETVADADILVIRENIGGLYQGEFGFEKIAGLRRAFHNLHYDDAQVARILEVAVAAARLRRGGLCVIGKPGGAPSISQLWREHAERLAAGSGIKLRFLEVDNACYQLVAEPRSFDVVAAPNLFGDVLADGATVLLGSRGLSYSANFSGGGRAVYQTGHGAAYDLAGSDRANPLGQIQSLAMLLRENFGLATLESEIRGAINDTLAAGWRTADIASDGCKVIGTQALGRKIAERLETRLAAATLTAA